MSIERLEAFFNAADQLDVGEFSDVLDVGCGTSGLVDALAGEGFDARGVDAAAAAVAGRGAAYAVCDARRLDAAAIAGLYGGARTVDALVDKGLTDALFGYSESRSAVSAFLDAARTDEAGNCALYVLQPDGSQRDISRPFNANPVLFLAGGDTVARKLLIEAPADAERFHLIDAPKSAASAYLPKPGPGGPDGGERVRDVSPAGGTLVLFDSVALPHEVLPSVGRDRLACSGWFHERVYPPNVHSAEA